MKPPKLQGKFKIRLDGYVLTQLANLYIFIILSLRLSFVLITI